MAIISYENWSHLTAAASSFPLMTMMRIRFLLVVPIERGDRGYLSKHRNSGYEKRNNNMRKKGLDYLLLSCMHEGLLLTTTTRCRAHLLGKNVCNSNRIVGQAKQKTDTSFRGGEN